LATHPKLKRSDTVSNFAESSWQLAISGATNPGVPQRVNRYFFSSHFVAKPKSIRTI